MKPRRVEVETDARGDVTLWVHGIDKWVPNRVKGIEVGASDDCVFIGVRDDENTTISIEIEALPHLIAALSACLKKKAA